MVHAEQERVTASLGNVLKVLDDVAKSSNTHLCRSGGCGERGWGGEGEGEGEGVEGEEEE